MEASERLEGRRILVVDDFVENAYLLKEVLEPQYEVEVAHDGVAALQRVGEWSPDLIILDVVMPKMNGIEVARTLRARPDCRAIPILMVTSLAEVDNKTEGLDAGADDYLCKPYSMTELLARVRSLLRIKALHDELESKNHLLSYVLDHYVSKEIAHEILKDPKKNLRLGGYSCKVTVLFVDVRGFTRFTEQHEAAYVVDVLNMIFKELAPVVFQCGGTLDKYLGDAIMALFGVPAPTLDDAEHAVLAAWTMQERFGSLQRSHPELAELGIGVGICTGEAIVGNIGSEQVMDYTVIGSTPNMASRLQNEAQSGQILIDERTWIGSQRIARAREKGRLMLKGRTEPLAVYEVLSVAGPMPRPKRPSHLLDTAAVVTPGGK